MTQPAAGVPSPSPSSVSEAGSTPSPTSQAVIASPSSESEDFASEVTPRPHDAIGRHESGDELLQSDASASDGEISSSDGEYSYSSDGEGHESVSHTASAESGSDRFHNAQEFVHPVAFKTKAEARAQLDGLENAFFLVTSNSRLSTRLSCTTHVDCTAEARIKKERNGQFRLFRSGMHTTETVDVMAQRTGIHKPFLSEVDNLLLGGQGPRQCLITLQTKYIDNDETLALLPSVSQLKNRAHKLRKRGDFDITSYADIMVWASPRMCFTKVTLFKDMSHRVEDDALRISHKPLEYQNELLVLDCFTDTLENGQISVGAIFTSRRLFRTAPRMMLGQRKEIMMATDGTYKLHFGGWTLVSFGTYGVRYNTTLQYQHKFYPAAFMFVRTETAYAYARLFTVVKDRTKEFFGGILDVQFGSMDHSSEITNAFRQVWPDIKLLNCWPHLDRNARRKNGLLTDSDRYENIIKPQLDYLSLSRSFDQFEALSNLVTSNWSALGETEYAHWLEDQYLVDPWDLWLYTASDEPGIVPNQNPIESHHHAIKTTAVMHLRAATGHVLARTLPRILSQCAMDFGSDIICHYASGPVGSEMIQAAMNLCASENHYPKHRGKSKRAILSIGQYYFNAEYYVVRGDNVHGLHVDASRTRLYERSLDGILRAHEKIENVQLRYLSLHRVTILERVPFEHNWDYPSWRVEEIKTIRQKFKCDCKTFYQSGWLYAHVLACLQLVDAVDLNAMLRGLPARRPPGRPRKKAKCLERDGVRRSQYSVSALIKRLVDKPASVINWSVLGTWTSTDDDGAEISRDFVGTVKPPFLRAGKRHWEVEYNEIEKLEEYEAEALATMINYSFRMGQSLFQADW